MFYDNLKQACDIRNLKITPIVEECGGAKGSISNWKKGAAPNSDIVARLSVRLNVSTDFLIFGEEKSRPEISGTAKEDLAPDEQELIDNYRKLSERDKGKVSGKAEALAEIVSEQQKENKPDLVPLYYVDNRVSAGLGASLSDYEQGATVYVPATPESRRADFILKISGDSMEPKFYDGEYVLVRSQQEIEIGQIGIFGNNGDGFIKKLGKRDLISLNSKYDPIPISEETTCFGLVLGTTEIISK